MKNKLGISRTDDVNDLLKSGLCTMAFQPILELQSEKIFGFEALLRGSNGTSLPNPDILFNREGYLENDVLLRLDAACIGSALRSGRELAKKHRLFINIHFSTLQYLSLHLDSFLCLLNELDINPENIVFEVSEKTDLSCAVNIEKYLRDFVKLGIQVAIDDIGGSFNWLHNMLDIKPSYLKVDKSFIHDIDSSRRKHALVQSLHVMSGTMGLHIIAEGIENPGQLKVLNSIGVTFAQGFWFGKPEAADKWLCR
jgi:EAL domain-containing protein (putative c-di-GMP-specific phosphodiesterase class I)